MSMIKLAEAQLLGFAHASKGYSIKDLAQAMGLSKKEWLKLRHSIDLKPSDKAELDAMFSISVMQKLI